MTATVEQARRAATGHQTRPATAPVPTGRTPDPWITPVDCCVCGRPGLPRLDLHPPLVQHATRKERPVGCALPPRPSGGSR